MIQIPAALDATGCQVPASPIPANAIAVVCDGSTYTVYEPGDTYPPPAPVE